MIHEVLQGDALALAKAQAPESVDCIVTSPPYWGLRDYGCEGQLGLEPHPQAYIEALLAHAAEWWRLLKPTGTLWVNLGDTYGRDGKKGDNSGYGKHADWTGDALDLTKRTVDAAGWNRPKQLLLIPARVAIALQEAGWLLRNDIIWAKKNPLPESVKDRFSCTYEHVFLMVKDERYWFDLDAVREPVVVSRRTPKCDSGEVSRTFRVKTANNPQTGGKRLPPEPGEPGAFHRFGKNPGDVWRIATQAFREAHFATYPEALVRRCVRAGCPPRVCAQCGVPWRREVEVGEPTDHPLRENRNVPAVQFSADGNEYRAGGNLGKVRQRTPGPWHPTCTCEAPTVPGLVLDPFCGSGTTGLVAVQEGRRFLGFELNPEYAEMAERRIGNAQPPLVLA